MFVHVNGNSDPAGILGGRVWQLGELVMKQVSTAVAFEVAEAPRSSFVGWAFAILAVTERVTVWVQMPAEIFINQA
jgi:hypothetical protein